MGGGSSTPIVTRAMEWISEQTPLLKYYIYNQTNNTFTSRRYFINSGRIDAEWGKQYWSVQSMLEFSFNNIINKVPEHGLEAINLLAWKSNLIDNLPNFLRYVNPSKTILNLIDQLVEFRIALAAKENLDSDPNTQARVIDYYHNTKLLYNPIDDKYIGMIGAVNKNISSDNLYYTIYNFLYSKITQQLTRDSLLVPGDFKFFLNMCVKIIEDKPLNQYGDNETVIEGIVKDAYNDAELANVGIFKNVDSLKGACKYLLFLYRKKNCSIYIMQNTKAVPDENMYRSCRIVGINPINKPQSIIESEKEAKEGFENFKGEYANSINQSSDSVNKFTSDSLPKVEKFEENNIFKKIETNLKLVLGYTLIVIVIGVLLYISPAVFNTLYNIIANYILPALLAILGVLGETIMVMTKLISTSMEALFSLIGTVSETTINILGSIFSIISDLVMVFIKFGADGVSGAVYYVIDQLSNVFKIITEGGQSILELIYNLFSSLAEKIFNYIKKFYMTINNIEGE